MVRSTLTISSLFLAALVAVSNAAPAHAGHCDALEARMESVQFWAVTFRDMDRRSTASRYEDRLEALRWRTESACPKGHAATLPRDRRDTPPRRRKIG